MKKIEIKNIYQVFAIILFIGGVLFSYLIAELGDAPGFIFFGTGITTFCCLLLYGLGDLISISQSNNKVLNDIYKKQKKGN